MSRMIQTGDVDAVVAKGIEPHHFADPEIRQVFESIVAHKNTWRTAPSPEAVQRMHPSFQPRVVADDIGYITHEFIASVNYRHAVEKWRDLQEAIDNPTQRYRLAEVFAEHARDMALLVPTPRVSRFSDMAERVIVRRRMQEAGVPPGIMLGFQDADRFVKGVRHTELVAFLGYTGMGKTQGMIFATHDAYMQGVQAPMFVSLEMENDELYEKFDALAAGVSSSAIRGYELTDEDYRKLESAAERARQFSSDIVVIDDTEGAATVDRIAALAERYKPGLICVDYISLMEAHRDIKGDWERVTHISRSLKRLARAMKIPVYAAAQSNRQAEQEGPTLDNIAYSLSTAQDANVILGFHQTPEWAAINKVEVRLLKARAGPKGSSFERWDRDRMIHEPWRMELEWLGKQAAIVHAAPVIPPPATSSKINQAALMQP